MKNDDSVLVDLSTLYDCQSDAKYIREMKIQSFSLGVLGVILAIFAFELKFNHGQVFLQFILNHSAINHPSVFFVFLIASLGNLIASKILYSEAKTEEKKLKRLKDAFLEAGMDKK